MEFPHLGKHCSEITCHKLDFLPMQCDSCNQVFCSSHFSYVQHACPAAHKSNVQVPVCPLCGEPVATPRGVAPDVTVGQHIDQFCKSETKKIFTNRCTFKNCKKKELIPVTCSLCRQNFCLRHRHTTDHDCKGGKSGESKHTASLAANAAEYRRTNKPTTLFTATPKLSPASRQTISQRTITTTAATANHVQSIQGNMSEDEALARALALSIMELDETADRNRRSEVAANQNNSAVSVGGRETQQQQQQANTKDKCSLS